jgi:hypothetical protein
MDLERVITKYTGRHLTRQQLERAMQLGGPAAELAMGIGSTAEAVGVTENELLRVIDTITRHTTTVRQVIAAEPGHPSSPLSRLDELQGSGVRFDALVAVRNAHLGHLGRLLRLWQLWPNSEDEPDPGPQR